MFLRHPISYKISPYNLPFKVRLTNTLNIVLHVSIQQKKVKSSLFSSTFTVNPIFLSYNYILSLSHERKVLKAIPKGSYRENIPRPTPMLLLYTISQSGGELSKDPKSTNCHFRIVIKQLHGPESPNDFSDSCVQKGNIS